MSVPQLHPQPAAAAVSLFAESQSAAAARAPNADDRAHDTVFDTKISKHTSPFWYFWRWLPFMFALVGLALLGRACYPHCRCRWCAPHTPTIDAEDQRIANLTPTQPLRASLMAQESSRPPLRQLDPSSLYAYPWVGQSPSPPSAESSISPYSPMHTHPYTFDTYQTSHLTGQQLLLSLPRTDMHTPEQTIRTVGTPAEKPIAR